MNKLINFVEGSSFSRAIVRVDFNVPFDGKTITDKTRIISAKDTIDYLISKNIKPILISHFKDPSQEDILDPKTKSDYSFSKLINQISDILNRKVILFDLYEDNLEDKINNTETIDVIMLDNSRFWIGEKKCDEVLSKKISNIGDFFVNEAFSCGHRNHASTVGVSKFLPTVPGIHFESEINALEKIFSNQKKPIVGIVGGSKISSKIKILENLLPKVDFLAIGGAMANNFFVYQGFNIGKSLFEKDYVKDAGELLEKYREKILLPCDVIVSTDISSKPVECEMSNGVKGIDDDMSAFDIGPFTVMAWSPILKSANTIIWNGTLGVTENDYFRSGSEEIAKIISNNNSAYSVVGGGDTVSFVNSLENVNFSHICTGGGAFLYWLANNKLLVEDTFN